MSEQQEVQEISQDSHVTLHYSLTLSDGRVVFSTFEAKPATFQLGTGVLPAFFEERLLGLSEGDDVKFHYEPEQAFGDRNPELVQKVTRSLLEQYGIPGEQYGSGDVLEFPRPDGGKYAGVIKGWGGADDDGVASWALIDFNHPLAGHALGFEVRIIGVL